METKNAAEKSRERRANRANGRVLAARLSKPILRGFWALAFFALLSPPSIVKGQAGTSGSGQSATSGSGASRSCGGNIQSSCGRTDLAVSLQSALPLPLGAQGYSWAVNQIILDPDLGSPIVRVTDGNTLASLFGSTSGECDFTTSDNPAASAWSSDELWFYFADCYSNHWLEKFNPATMQTTAAPWAGNSGKYELPYVNLQFGRQPADAGKMIGQGSNPTLVRPDYDVTWVNASSYTNSSPTFNAVKDLSTCPGLGWLANASFPRNARSWLPQPFIDFGDTSYLWTAGPLQNEGWISVYYKNPNGLFSGNTSGDSCNWLDLRTGAMGGTTWSGQATSGIPMTPTSNGGPGSAGGTGIPTFTQTTGGSLTTGHTIDLAFSFAFQCYVEASSCYLNTDGAGETNLSAVQRVTLSGSNNAITSSSTIPYFPVCPQPDTIGYSHYNIYAQDEANCGGAQCSASQLVLQPAGNMTIAGSSPISPGTCTVGTNLTASNYICTWVLLNYTLWAVGTSSGIANSTITQGAVTGQLHCQIIRGPWRNGTATCDPINDGSSCYTNYGPTVISDGGSNQTYTDNSSQYLLAATGTITAGSSFVLKSLSTSGTPPPAYSTLGIFAHAAIMDQAGQWVHWGTEPDLDGGDWIFDAGGNGTDVIPLNVTASSETVADTYTSAANSYTAIVGHSVMGNSGNIWEGGGPYIVDQNFDRNYRPSTGWRTLAPSGSNCRTDGGFPHPANTCRLLTAFPAADPNGADNMDAHQSWTAIAGGVDLTTPFIDSTTVSGNQTYQAPTLESRAWMGEILETDPNTGTQFRLAHIRATGVAYDIANCSVSPHCESQFDHDGFSQQSPKGDFVLFDSDMGWLTGCDPSTGGTAPNFGCTFDGSGHVKSGRSLVSVYVLKVH